MMNRRLHLILLTLIVLCAPIRDAAGADKLRISYSAVNATQAFLWVAQDRGIFAKHGLEGELLYINSGTMNIAALLGGSVQIAGGGPVSIEARLRGIKLTILGNPLPWLASNLIVHPDIKSIPDMAGKFAGISRFGSSTDQGFRYLFRKNGLNVDRDLKMLQMGADSSRVAALKAGTIQYTFLGAAATDNGDVGMVFLPERGREHVDRHAGHGAVTRRSHRGERSTADEQGVVLGEHCGKVDVRVHDDPIGFAVGAGNVAVEADGAAVSHSSHETSF